MSDEKAKGTYTLDVAYTHNMLDKSGQQLEFIADLLSIETREDPMYTRVITLLCDSFSANYHLWKILSVNLDNNLFYDEETKQSYILTSSHSQDLYRNRVI
jgi:hypothetical protein